MIHRGVEQLAARRAHNPEVGGSSPPPATTTGETAMFLLFSFAGVGLERLTFTFPLNPPLTKGDLWQDLVLHCFAIYVAI